MRDRRYAGDGWRLPAPWGGDGCHPRRCAACTAAPLAVRLPAGSGKELPFRIFHGVRPAGEGADAGGLSGAGDRHVHPLPAGEMFCRRWSAGGKAGDRRWRRWCGGTRRSTHPVRSTTAGEKSARFRYLFSRLRETALVIVKTCWTSWSSRISARWPSSWASAERTGSCRPTVTAGTPPCPSPAKVDRVDGWMKDGKLYLRVVDYKTGKRPLILADVRYGLGIQMLLYLSPCGGTAELFRRGGGAGGRAVRPGAGRGKAGGSRHPAGQAGKAAAGRAAPHGYAAQRPGGAVRHGAQRAGKSPCYLPIAVKKDGSVSGRLASVCWRMAQMGKMGRYVDSLLRQAARELGGGNIDADPCRRGPQESACDWCPFASACWFDEKRDKPRYLQRRRRRNSGRWWTIGRRNAMADVQLTPNSTGGDKPEAAACWCPPPPGRARPRCWWSGCSYLTEEHCHIDDFLIITFTARRRPELRSKAGLRAGQAGGAVAGG